MRACFRPVNRPPAKTLVIATVVGGRLRRARALPPTPDRHKKTAPNRVPFLFGDATGKALNDPNRR